MIQPLEVNRLIYLTPGIVSREGLTQKKQGQPKPSLRVLVGLTLLFCYRIKDSTKIQT